MKKKKKKKKEDFRNRIYIYLIVFFSRNLWSNRGFCVNDVS
jgi:hypothetical protein